MKANAPSHPGELITATRKNLTQGGKRKTLRLLNGIRASLGLLMLGILTCFPQGFVNLNFESAHIIPLTEGALFPPYSVATTNALPGWTVYIGSNQQSQVTYNDPAVGSTSVSIWATNGQQISGNYSTFLQGGLTSPAASISQTGVVPLLTRSLLFQARSGFRADVGSLVVTLGGQNISYSALSAGPNYTLYGGDISAFAGQSQPLMFSALHGAFNNWNIDNIQFSPSVVPEPSQLALAALGGLLLGLRRWQKLKTKIATWLLLATGLCASHAQGFINLNFETTTISGGTATVPGWTWTTGNYVNGDPNSIPYNNLALSASAVNLEGTNAPVASAIQGNYSIFIQGGDRFYFFTNGASIMQTAQIPVSAQSIIYWGGILQVAFNGQALSLNAIGSGANYTIWGIDISHYAGQTGTLVFHAPWQSEAILDNIQFSPSVVPEPRQLALAALGTLLLGLRRWQKLKAKIATWLLLATGLCASHAQGFVNLDFEQAKIVIDPHNGLYASNAIPGWTAYIRSSPQTYIGYNSINLIPASVDLMGTNGLIPALQGKYSIYLQGSFGGPPASAGIGQTGQIPSSAMSLFFWGSMGTKNVAFNGQALVVNQTGSIGRYGIFSADISSYAGQTGELLFTAYPGQSLSLDNLQFSASPVPEPGGLALATLGILLLGYRRRSKASR